MGAVAIGADSIADMAYTVSLGNASADLLRRLTNMADGEEPSDAVTVGQLSRLRMEHEQLKRNFEHLEQKYDALHEQLRQLSVRND